MTHELEHSFILEVAPSEVWGFLWRVEAVACCIPGCELVTVQEELKSYQAHIKKKIGPFAVRMILDVLVTDLQPPESLSVRITGQDRRLRSQVTQSIAVRLHAQGEESTEVTIKGNFTLEGLLGSINRNLVSGQVSQVLDDFSVALRAAILAKAAANP
jgi:carbon monoxide dehydrogenase subunit G